MRYLMLAGYIAIICAANWAVSTIGPVSVGFGLVAPAGVYFAGLGLTLRDGLHEEADWRWVLGAILAGAAFSFFLGSGRIAIASGVAFLVSELVDWSIYTPVRERSKLWGIACSNVVGAAVDSYLFLAIAFGSLAFFWGQFVGKMWVTLATVGLVLVLRAGVRRAILPRDA